MQHPIEAWRERSGLSTEQLAVLVAAAGKPTTAAYLRQIELGHSRPLWELACAISRATGGSVSPEEIMHSSTALRAARKSDTG